MAPVDADALLRRVHERLGGMGLDIITFGAGEVEVRWRRRYGYADLSEERFEAASALTAALEAVLRREDEEDAREVEEGRERA